MLQKKATFAVGFISPFPFRKLRTLPAVFKFRVAYHKTWIASVERDIIGDVNQAVVHWFWHVARLAKI